MMEFEKWFDKASDNPAAGSSIPMGYQPTLPVICRKHGVWCVRFYYYRMHMDEQGFMIETPAYIMEFDAFSEKMIYFEKLLTGVKNLGCCEDFFLPDFQQNQKKYMNIFEEAVKILNTDKELKPEEQEKMMDSWITAHPALLQDSLKTAEQLWREQHGGE